MLRHPIKILDLGGRKAERGFYLIGLLMVVVIIMILSAGNFRSATGGGSTTTSGQSGQSGQAIQPTNALTGAAQKRVTEVEAGIARIDRAGADGCEASMAALRTDMAMINAMAMGQLPGPKQMHEKLGHFRCPRKGRYQYDDNGNVYCEKHFPPAAGVSVTNL